MGLNPRFGAIRAFVVQFLFLLTHHSSGMIPFLEARISDRARISLAGAPQTEPA
jgi:hypothetical protein